MQPAQLTWLKEPEVTDQSPALAVSTPQNPGTLSEGALYTCTLLPPAHTLTVLPCSALQAALGSQPGGRVPPQ